MPATAGFVTNTSQIGHTIASPARGKLLLPPQYNSHSAAAAADCSEHTHVLWQNASHMFGLCILLFVFLICSHHHHRPAPALPSCILEMDHHCPWIRNCVGYMNHKYFFLLLFYGACALIMFAVVMMSRFLQATRNIFTWVDVVIITAWLLDVMLAGVITTFFFFHCYLLLGGYTTIEFCEKMSSQKSHVASIYKGGSPYNRGLCKNIMHLLGPCPLFWLLPVRWGMSFHDGVFPTPSEDGKRRFQVSYGYTS